MRNILLVYPEFSSLGFWNYRDVCELIGAKYPAAPLGIITVAAFLPEHWNIKLVNMNTVELVDSDIDWADLVFISGMLPQQINFLKLSMRIHERGKKVVAGGPGPTSQPDIYKEADYLVLGEAEETMPAFLKDLENGVQEGVYSPGLKKPDITKSPVPRFDLLDFKDYLMVGIQFSRGCPYNCEFCDIIELFGRIPRTKTPDQIVRELNILYEMGYRGLVDFVDDNFIGHKKRTKEILRAIEVWTREHNYPFYFSTEATINLADDDELLELMKAVDFRFVFIGIETTDEAILKDINKPQNMNRNLNDCLHKIYDYGIIVNGGFIIGFDNETSLHARALADVIDRGNICFSMVGLLYALPNTQLARRLKKENRLVADSHVITSDIIDQASSGLNFITKRPVNEIINDFIFVIENIYNRKNYFNKCLNICRILKSDNKHKVSFPVKIRFAIAFLRIVVKLGLKPPTSYYFWRNIFSILVTRPSNVENIVSLMAMYLHFRKQSKYIIQLMTRKLKVSAV